MLLADDNEATCTLITALLQSDFAVEIASDGGEAIEKLKSTAVRGHPARSAHAGRRRLRRARFPARRTPDLLRRVLVVTAALGTRGDAAR